jgi:P27 family predicted phage terminase small subunit
MFEVSRCEETPLMGKRGPPRKPMVLHRLQGTRPTQKGRHEPQAHGELTAPPVDLTDTEQANWAYHVEHAPAGLLKRVDAAILKTFVRALDRHDIAAAKQRQLDQNSQLPLLVKGPDGSISISPYVTAMERAENTMLRCIRELGFSPAARANLRSSRPIEVDGQDPEDDPWAMLDLPKGEVVKFPAQKVRRSPGSGRHGKPKTPTEDPPAA